MAKLSVRTLNPDKFTLLTDAAHEKERCRIAMHCPSGVQVVTKLFLDSEGNGSSGSFLGFDLCTTVDGCCVSEDGLATPQRVNRITFQFLQ